jgi:antitoxin (DNA-binding transcriptional repressor) of toxin-antitoxin stability system
MDTRCTLGYMSELPVEDTRGIAGAAHDAARGQVVYITEHGHRLAAIVPAELAAEIEEDLADAADARDALAEPGEIPWEQVKAEAGL